MALTPYVFYNGDCQEAFRFYHEVLGGDLQVMRNADAPEGNGMPGAEPHHVMHAALISSYGQLLGSDDPTSDGGPKVGVAVTISAPDETEGKRIFDGLSAGGRVDMPFGPAFFSKGFGAFNDRFGVPWMVVTEGDV